MNKSDTKKYVVEYEEDASDDLDDLPKRIKSQIIKATEKLADNPRIGNVTALKGYKNLHRLRTGDYRVIYSIEEDVLVVIVVALGHRKDIYEVLKQRIG